MGKLVIEVGEDWFVEEVEEVLWDVVEVYIVEVEVMNEFGDREWWDFDGG